MPYSDPKYPVVNPDPDVDTCISAMRIRDWAVLGGVTAASWGYGYVLGKPVRSPTAATAAALGLTFGCFVVLQDTRGRLMGYKENAKEVKKFGALTMPTKVEQKSMRFPTATGMSTTKELRDWTNHK